MRTNNITKISKVLAVKLFKGERLQLQRVRNIGQFLETVLQLVHDCFGIVHEPRLAQSRYEDVSVEVPYVTKFLRNKKMARRLTNL